MADETVVVDGAAIHVEVTGHGVPLVLIHGLGLSGALWNRVCDSFPPGYRLIRVDLRGAGRTRETVRGELSLARWADDLAAVLRALELRDPVLVGHSLGACVALKYALERPDGLRGIVLIGAEANLGNLAPRMLASAERIETLGMAAWVEQFWTKSPPFSASSLRREPAILVEYRDLLLENDPGDYLRQCRAIAVAENLEPRLRELACPALVVIGGRDDRTLPEHGRRLAREIPGATLIELDEAGHSIPLEAPEETAHAITSFEQALAPRAAARRNGAHAVLRADSTPRNPSDGPFGHLDIRWVVGPETGASLIAFGQSTYPFGATHENHYHPHAEEVVMVVSGRGTQIVGPDALEVGAGDICFIPRNTPHRITGTSEDTDLVILWAFGGAASIEMAGYVPLPDDEEESK